MTDLIKENRELQITCTEHWNKFREQEEKVEVLELEIMKLKAKLYDLLVKE